MLRIMLLPYKFIKQKFNSYQIEYDHFYTVSDYTAKHLNYLTDPSTTSFLNTLRYYLFLSLILTSNSSL
ncbi:protein of unknown function [Clostridium beijerinckii]|nr:protein of unknown function [Clostridium beijerinckii]